MSAERRPYCFMDFDGTLTDNRERLYHFYTANAPQGSGELLTIEEFWERKRLGIHELEQEQAARAAYDAEKKRVIETPEYLAKDRVFTYSKDALERIRGKYDLILLTRRSHSDFFYEEWERTGLAEYFTAVHVIPHSYGGKADFIRDNYAVDPERDVIVGDTEDDLKAGRELGLISFLVLSGIRTEWIVQKYFADYAERIRVVADIREVI